MYERTSQTRLAVEELLDSIDVPGLDVSTDDSPPDTFPDGGHYKIEMVTHTLSECRELLSTAAEVDLRVNRITDVSGTAYNTDETLREKCRLCRDHDVEFVIGAGLGEQGGDVSHQAALGALRTGSVRGSTAIRNAVADVQRAAAQGCRGFILYDEGLLDVCCRLRERGDLPVDTTFKLSSAFSIANPAALGFWDRTLLAPRDSVNPIRDMTVPMLEAMRSSTECPLDVHAFWRTTIARTLDLPEIARTAAPVYLKNSRSGDDVTLADRIEQAVRITETIDRYWPDGRQSTHAEWGLPARIEE